MKKFIFFVILCIMTVAITRCCVKNGEYAKCRDTKDNTCLFVYGEDITKMNIGDNVFVKRGAFTRLYFLTESDGDGVKKVVIEEKFK